MTLIFLTLIIISLGTGCQNGKSDTKTDDKSSTAKEEKVQKELFKQNDEAFMTNENGEKIYSLTINSSKAMDIPGEYVEEIPNDTKNVLVITYTFKFIKEDEKMGSLYISPSDLQVYDENGMAIEFLNVASIEYPFGGEVLFGFGEEGLKAGRSKQAYGAFGLKKDTQSIQIDFNSDVFQKSLTFELPVQS
ncbi:MAG: putative lipoprotein [Neobacillus sp.]|nr:putative lipoprotein [Neobacillus sp.]